MISAAQVRAARAILGIKQTELAALADLSEPTVKNIEQGKDVRGATMRTIERVLGDQGIEFLGIDGVRLKT